MNDMKPVRVALSFMLVFVLSTSVFAQQKIPTSYDELKKTYEALLKDRDNLRVQSRSLLEYKNQVKTAQQQLSQIDNERTLWDLEEQALQTQVKKLQSENEALIEKVAGLQEDHYHLEKEKNTLRKSVSKSKAGYIIVDELNRKIKVQRKEISRLEKKIKSQEKLVAKVEENLVKAEAHEEILRDQVKEIKLKYKKAVAQNKTLEKKINRQPREYAEIARENKVLLKRTALMHYNLGVFYTKNNEYVRAIAEFEKSIELNPGDAQAYFNLGYIYAEHFEDRQKAISNFQKYLRIAKKDDQDIDWVKKYLLFALFPR